ncbi:hypothetical protein O3M35_010881 [Rhynocoris fuscipes]|uniref:Pre-rRNA-processing protein RIX1 N-terminal domain-containing protein n=1 Tax=Rhynocoris fuscipes TaxID=488301 RepID=A0AAW1D0Q3_9HEMI
MNNDILELLKLALNDSNPFTLKNLLKVCQDSKLFQKPNCNVENVIAFINHLLNLSTDCKNGVLILKVLLPQCKSDVIGIHLMQWLNLCVKALSSNQQTPALYELIRQLIIYSKDYPDIKKQTSMAIIPKIMDYHFKGTRKLSPKIEILFLLCLEEILLNYGRACGYLRGKIEQFLLSKLEGSSNVVHLCAKCYLNLLASTPTGNSSKEDFQEVWNNKQVFLISALHQQLDDLFHSINEIQGTYDEYIVEFDRKSIPEISDESPLNQAQRLTHLFSNLAQFLSVLLLGPFPLEKSVNPEAIFSIICRGLSVNCRTLEANITCDTLILSTQIPAIQEACLGLLDALIQSCRRALYSHGPLICKLLTQTLKWTKTDKCDYGQEKPYSALRVKAYNCFTNWLTDSRKCSNAENYIYDIMQPIISDVHYSQPSVTLSITSKRLKGKVGKKQRKHNQLNSNTDNIRQNVINTEANKEICAAALNFIPSLLEATFDLISPKFHKRLQELIINEIVTLQVADNLSLDLPIPYSDECCRYGLFKSLLALCNYYHPEFTIPSNYAITLFETGLNDISLEISRFCGQAVANIEKIITPIGCTLKYPLKLGEDITSLDNNQMNQEINVIDETLTGESITRLFEVETRKSNNVNNIIPDKEISLEKSTVNVEESTKELENIVEDSVEIISIDESINKERIQVNDENESMRKSNGDIAKTDQIKEIIENNLESDEDKLRVDCKKRLIDDENNAEDLPLEKKKKENSQELQTINVNSELEDSMLSSFVDIVK